MVIIKIQNRGPNNIQKPHRKVTKLKSKFRPHGTVSYPLDP